MKLAVDRDQELERTGDALVKARGRDGGIFTLRLAECLRSEVSQSLEFESGTFSSGLERG